MLKTSIRINEHTDVAETLQLLKNRAKSSRIEHHVLDTVLEQSKVVIEEFFDRGTSMVRMGSQMRARRTIEGPDYSIMIIARFGTSDAIWDQIVGLVRRRDRV